MNRVWLLGGVALMLTACVHHDGVRVRRADVDLPGARIILGDEGHSHRDDGHFCPPGQAKKGRC